jgi:hypothetical protein
VPLFLGVGEHDIATEHHTIPSSFPASRDVTLFVLDGAGHNHNVEPGRAQLWERVTDWAGRVALEKASTADKASRPETTSTAGKASRRK